MKLCPKCGSPNFVCCDFCKHFDFNADAKGHYTGDGYCRLHRTQADPGEVCNDFHCEHLKENKKKVKVKSK